MAKTELFVRKQTGGMFNVVNEGLTTGNIFFVDSGSATGADSSGYGSNPDKPFLTLDYANSKCTANNGDRIYCMPGHAETISTATALALDTAGVSVYGLGVGNDRPTFTVGTLNTATITVSAASVTWKNCIVVSALDGLNTAITITGNDCDIDLEHRDTSSSVEADIAITCTGDRPKIKLRDIGFIAGDQRDQSIVLTGVDNGRIDIDFYGKVGTAVVNFVTTACKDIVVTGTTYVSETTNGSKNVVDTATNSTWYMDVMDAAAGARYTGGSASAVASDDVSAVASKADSVGIQVSTVDSRLISTVLSLGIGTSTIASTVLSTAASVGTGTSTVASTVLSTATSVGVGTSQIQSTQASLLTQLSTNDSTARSAIASVGTGTSSASSTVLSTAASVGVGTSQIQSILASLALIISTINSNNP